MEQPLHTLLSTNSPHSLNPPTHEHPWQKRHNTRCTFSNNASSTHFLSPIQLHHSKHTIYLAQSAHSIITHNSSFNLPKHIKETHSSVMPYQVLNLSPDSNYCHRSILQTRHQIYKSSLFGGFLERRLEVGSPTVLLSDTQTFPPALDPTSCSTPRAVTTVAPVCTGPSWLSWLRLTRTLLVKDCTSSSSSLLRWLFPKEIWDTSSLSLLRPLFLKITTGSLSLFLHQKQLYTSCEVDVLKIGAIASRFQLSVTPRLTCVCDDTFLIGSNHDI